MPLTATDLPAEVDAFGVRFTMQDWTGTVRCHVFRAALDHLEERPARTPQETLDRFNKSRGRFERLASRLHDAGHRTPWVAVHDMMTGVLPEPFWSED